MNNLSQSVCVVGSAMFDQITRATRIPKSGETVVGNDYRTGFGGKGSNQAVMAARLGAPVTMVVKLGRDPIGEATLANYRAEGIDTDYVYFDDRLPSGVAPIWVDETTGHNSIIVVPGANAALSPGEVKAAEAIIRSSAVVVCQNEIPVSSTMEAFRIARTRPGVITIYNPAPAMAVPGELLGLTDYLIPNQHEAEIMTGRTVSTDEDIAAAAARLRELGARNVIITLGDRGAYVQDENGSYFVAASRVTPVDTTGAGVAFVGSLAYFLSTRLELQEAVRKACAIATFSVMKHGTQTSFPRAAEIADIL
jgi:ribokinase